MVEVLHATVYYAPERPDVYARAGFKGGWMGYFATRSAALGEVPPEVVTACFYGFALRMVRRALPDAWRYASPEAAVAARYEVFDRLSKRVLGADTSWADAVLVRELESVVDGLDGAGSPLFAANAALARPSCPHLRLFWAVTALREYRGDAHVAALRLAGVDPVQSHVLMVALGLTPSTQREYRGWTEDEWARGVESLRTRGWLDRDGNVTVEGQHERARIERNTDRMSAVAWRGRGTAWLTDIVSRLTPAVAHTVTSGAVPFPNAMGAAAVPEIAVHP